MATPDTAAATLYDPHPSLAIVAKWLAELKEKTGRDLAEWKAHIKEHGPATEAAQRSWLKETFGMGTNTAWWLAEQTAGRGDEHADPAEYLRVAEQYVRDMYAGAKSGLLPLHHALIQSMRKLGPEIKVCPCQTQISIFRTRVIAQLRPRTRTQLDLGLALGDPARLKSPPNHLVDTGGFAKKDRITAKFIIERPDQIDDTVLRWLQIAFDRDAAAPTAAAALAVAKPARAVAPPKKTVASASRRATVATSSPAPSSSTKPAATKARPQRAKPNRSPANPKATSPKSRRRPAATTAPAKRSPRAGSKPKT